MPAIEARVERFAAMGTRIELHQFGRGGDEALAAARHAIEAVDDALTIHRPSPATALNDRLVAGGSAPIDDALLFDALVLGEEAWVSTDGLFDPTVDAASGGGRWGAITLDRQARRIEADGPVAFDFGGFGKGYALDRAGSAMRAAGVDAAFLSAGESSIAVIGAHPLGGAWSLAVPHPDRPGDDLVTIEVADASLSISSTADRASMAPGRSPTLRPADGAIVVQRATSVAVEATGAEAEAMSTALLIAVEDLAAPFLAAAPGRRYRFVFADRPAGPPHASGYSA